jgi:hypothetical protein
LDTAEGHAVIHILGTATEAAAVLVVVAVLAKSRLLRQTNLLTKERTRRWGRRHVTFAGAFAGQWPAIIFIIMNIIPITAL